LLFIEYEAFMAIVCSEISPGEQSSEDGVIYNVQDTASAFIIRVGVDLPLVFIQAVALKSVALSNQPALRQDTGLQNN
jgi:hypothetical protein